MSQKPNNLAFAIDYVESSVSDEGRVLLFISRLRFFTAFMNCVHRLSACVQKEIFETTSFYFFHKGD